MNHITQKNKVINETLRSNLTNEMLVEVEETFSLAMDQTTGTIPSNKLPLVLKAMGMNIQDADDVKIPAEVDLDKLVEIVIVCTKQPGWAANEMNESFAIFDKDASGYIDPIELRRVFMRIGENLNEQELDDQLKEFDIDGDMEMAVAEYYNMINTTKGSDFNFEDSLF
jgi:Ca2+-binding EF-hand superfamily protein